MYIYHTYIIYINTHTYTYIYETEAQRGYVTCPRYTLASYVLYLKLLDIELCFVLETARYGGYPTRKVQFYF